jgi:hypothetical protein
MPGGPQAARLPVRIMTPVILLSDDQQEEELT